MALVQGWESSFCTCLVPTMLVLVQVQSSWPVFVTFWAWSLSEVIRYGPNPGILLEMHVSVCISSVQAGEAEMAAETRPCDLVNSTWK